MRFVYLNRGMFTSRLDHQDRLRSKPYFIGAPGMNRTCDLRFRKAVITVRLDMTDSGNRYFVNLFVQLLTTCPCRNFQSVNRNTQSLSGPETVRRLFSDFQCQGL